MTLAQLSHTAPRRVGRGLAVPLNVGAAIEHSARAMQRARLCFGHGTDNARDEAAELVYFVARLDHALGTAGYARTLTPLQATKIAALLKRRISERRPLPYLTRRAFFAGLTLYVDEHVLVPRSPIAELILQRFAPWIDRPVRCIADIGTGSGAIALACATAFPRAQVDAVDISPAALRICRRNVRNLRLAARVRVLRSDHFEALQTQRYDIIVANPPYVGREEMRRLPREYRHEPRLGLAAGADGLDSVRVILREAHRHLEPRGILVVEVGNSERALLRAFPRLPFVWPDIAIGGGGIFVLKKEDLSAAGVQHAAIRKQRRQVAQRGR